MDLLSRSTILYVNQTRQDDFEKLIGKGFSEALSWRKDFKRVIFVCYSTTNRFFYKKIYDNCYLIAIPFDLSESAVISMVKTGFNYFKLFSFLLKLTKITEINVIRMENLLLSGPSVYLLSKFRKIPYVIWLGGHERNALIFKYGKNLVTWVLAQLIKLYEKFILKQANFIFSVTQDLMDLTKERNVVNTFFSPNFIDLSNFKELSVNKKDISKKIIQLLFVGRFEEEKGLKVLLKAIKGLPDEKDQFELNLVGEGSLKVWIESFIKENNLMNVRFLGRFDHKDMPKIYNSADIFILPSYTEGSPASLIEAMSCGIASIATAVGESKKYISDGENGILISPGDPKELIKAIKSFINNRALIEKFGKNGRTSVIKYTKNYKKIHKFVYEQILKRSQF